MRAQGVGLEPTGRRQQLFKITAERAGRQARMRKRAAHTQRDHPGGVVELIEGQRHYQLRDSGSTCLGRGADTAVVHQRSGIREQLLKRRICLPENASGKRQRHLVTMRCQENRAPAQPLRCKPGRREILARLLICGPWRKDNWLAPLFQESLQLRRERSIRIRIIKWKLAADERARPVWLARPEPLGKQGQRQVGGVFQEGEQAVHRRHPGSRTREVDLWQHYGTDKPSFDRTPQPASHRVRHPTRHCQRAEHHWIMNGRNVRRGQISDGDGDLPLRGPAKIGRRERQRMGDDHARVFAWQICHKIG